jgi:hypothetical protein
MSGIRPNGTSQAGLLRSVDRGRPEVSQASGEDRAPVSFGSSSVIDLPGAGTPIPRQQIVEPLRGMLCDAGQNVGEPRLWIDVVHLGR